MNELLKNYLIDTQHPDVSGIEHLQMLRNRTKLAALMASFSAREQQQLAIADQMLVAHAHEFVVELSRFINFAEERRRLQITPEQWWWYLDIIAELPDYLIRQPEAAALTA